MRLPTATPAFFADATRAFVSASGQVMLVLVPHGGQRTARRNALHAVRNDVAAAHNRAEALASLLPVQPTKEPAAS